MNKFDAPTGDTPEQPSGWIYKQEQDWDIGDILFKVRQLKLNPRLSLSAKDRMTLAKARDDIDALLNVEGKKHAA